MDIKRTQKVLLTHIFFVIIIGFFAFFIAPSKSVALTGLGIGAISTTANNILLFLMMKYLLAENYFLTVQIYVLRLLIYLVSAFFSVRTGTGAALTFGFSVVCISLAITLVYGIGGLKNND